MIKDMWSNILRNGVERVREAVAGLRRLLTAARESPVDGALNDLNALELEIRKSFAAKTGPDAHLPDFVRS